MSSRAHALALLLAVLAAAPATRAAAQDRGSVGAFAGVASSRQLWRSPFESDPVTGVTLGIFADVRTPAPAFSVMAGLGYVRRGGMVWNQREDPERTQPATLTVDYLTMHILAKARMQWGPGAAYLVAGPTLDQFLRANRNATLNQILQREKTAVFSGSLGAGLEIELDDHKRVDLEVRVVEGLSNAFEGQSGTVRHRSLEFVVRAGHIIR